MNKGTNNFVLYWVLKLCSQSCCRVSIKAESIGEDASMDDQQSNTQKTDCCCCQVASVMSDSVRPHRRQPNRLPQPWDSPGKNTGVGSHFLVQCMKVESEREVAQSCPTLSDPMDCSLPGSSVHGIFQARKRTLNLFCYVLNLWDVICFIKITTTF